MRIQRKIPVFVFFQKNFEMSAGIDERNQPDVILTAQGIQFTQNSGRPDNPGFAADFLIPEQQKIIPDLELQFIDSSTGKLKNQRFHGFRIAASGKEKTANRKIRGVFNFKTGQSVRIKTAEFVQCSASVKQPRFRTSGNPDALMADNQPVAFLRQTAVNVFFNHAVCSAKGISNSHFFRNRK